MRLRTVVVHLIVFYLFKKSLAGNVNKTNVSEEDYFSYEEYFSNEEIETANINSTATSLPTTTTTIITTTVQDTKTLLLNNKTSEATTVVPPLIKPQVHQFYNVTLKHIPQIIAGEALNITVIVQNYLKSDFYVNITQENHESGFMNVQLTNDFVDIKTTKELRVPPKSSKSVQFALKTYKSQRGPLRIEYKIESIVGVETKWTTLFVKSEGVYHEAEHYYYVDLENAFKFSKRLDLYQELFGFHSEKIELHGYGNAIFPLLPYLNTTIKSHTAEQAVSAMILNHIALEYLKISNRIDFKWEFKLKNNILEAFEQLYDYFNRFDGSYNNFLRKQHTKGSTWLTAYIMAWLPKFKDHVDVLSPLSVISLDFLLKQQEEDGSFIEKGDVFNKKQNCSVAMTAHVILALLEQQTNDFTVKIAIESGLKYIQHKLNPKTLKSKHSEYICLYSKAIATFALYKAGHASFRNEFNKLKRLVKSEGEYVWWTEDDNDDMESTAYILLTTLATRADHWSVKDILPILKWLVTFGHIYTNSVLYPTKATITGLMAIIQYEEKFNVLRPSMTVDVKSMNAKGEAYENKMTIKDAMDNKLLKLPASASEIEVFASGKGSALAHISHAYFLMDIKDANDFTLTVNLTKSSEQPAFNLKMNLCLEYNNLQSNLIIIVAPFPTGYTLSNDGLQQIYNTKGVRLVTIDQEASLLKIFIVDLQYKDIRCTSIKMKRLFNVACQRPIPVYAYEYNDLSKRDIKYLELPSTLCDLCEKDRQCKKYCKTES